ncbi:PREDICTED: uncharacterized protein LOC108773956 [Cyphomyrmex costatus]|uniref:uncharacterized protein LOC108773956 n=1 Tax=Cyphomyrmex costatus TaxID=456900 RepID=UPI000852245C|nr:PREDICTED: uncharacterized protein LOC108773956 [Cyphomyrmex costatus]
MYRQVLVDSNQTALQRILWRESPDVPIKTFELLTVTYGLASAAYLAIRTLRKLAEDNENHHPKASQIALRDFYVDDLVTGADSPEEALLIKKEITLLLQKGGFEIRKWASNIQALQDQNFSVNPKEFGLSPDKTTEKRTLGITWDCHTDEFKCSSINHLPHLDVPTKRRVLSRIALIYDPLGLVGPVTLLAKIIMQELWRLKLEWDEAIPLDLYTKWKRFEAELHELDKLRIPRLVTATEQHSRLELHGFADASENAYGACIYLCSTSINDERCTRLLCSKSRVAPLKSLSLPRLELCGAVLLAQLINKVSKCHTCQISSIYLWTDSTIVLSWLQSCSCSWSTFVAHWVGEIQELTSIHQWNHIRSEDNPADVLSLGVMPGSLSQMKIWWSGPSWLELDKESWPQGAPPGNETDLPERKAKTITVAAAVTSEPDIFYLYSNFTKLIRVVTCFASQKEHAGRRLHPTNAKRSHIHKINLLKL